MTDSDSSKPLLDASVRLCAAVKKHKCLYGPYSHHKNTAPDCEDAWEIVAEECNETIEFCKKRWKTVRRCFFQGVKRRGNKYYLHDHLQFLLEGKKKIKQNPEELLNDETNSNVSDTLHKTYDDGLSLQGSEMETINTFDDDEDVKTISSQTSNADESNENIHTTQMGVFIINEFDEEAVNANESLVDDKRLNFNRSCKRALNPDLIDELTAEEPEEKRSRKIVTEKPKTLTNDTENGNIKSQLTNKQVKVRVDKIRINLAESRVEPIKGKMVDRFTYTDFKQTRDFGTQYDFNSQQFDDIFMQSIKTQLMEMNSRQKMNFKRKIYQSLLEVFDDATDFPNYNDILPPPQKQAPRIVNTTVGELRLMRELVSLVQAAKSTPEIMNAKEKVKTSTPIQNKPPPKMPLPIKENRSNCQQTLPISLSPTLDDDDLQFSIDNIDDDDEVPLPRSWDEIKPKSTEPNKAITIEDNTAGVPRRVLQKVVRVSGANGSTIVTRDGDKKRIYRIYPKAINPNENRTLPAKNNNSVGTFFVSPSKNPKDIKYDNGSGTFFVSSSKNQQDTAANSIKITSLPNLTVRPSIDKSTNRTNETTNTVYKNNQPNFFNSINNTTNTQTVFQNVHPANRILSPTTGLFKTVPTPQPVTTTNIQKPSTIHSTGTPTSSTSLKVMTTKMPASTMLPPTANITNKRTSMIRPGTQIMQRRYSVCGALPADNISTPNSTATAAKVVTSTSSGNPQTKSSVSQIQISQPVSLNTKVMNSQTSSSRQNTSSNNNAFKSNTSTAPVPVNFFESRKEYVAAKNSVTSASDEIIPNNTSSKPQDIPILQTAGTVEADILDPLFVKPPQIKSEPVDE